LQKTIGFPAVVFLEMFSARDACRFHEIANDIYRIENEGFLPDAKVVIF
jgi:hypothetical protein